MAQSYSVLARDAHVMLHNRDPPEMIGNNKLLCMLNCLKKKNIQKFFGLCLYFWRVPVQREGELHGAGPPGGLGAGGGLGGGGAGDADQAGHAARPRALWYQHHVLIICLVFAGLEVWMDA